MEGIKKYASTDRDDSQFLVMTDAQSKVPGKSLEYGSITKDAFDFLCKKHIGLKGLLHDGARQERQQKAEIERLNALVTECQNTISAIQLVVNHGDRGKRLAAIEQILIDYRKE